MKSLKKTLIQNCFNAVNLEELKGNKVILITAAGMIIGTLSEDSDILADQIMLGINKSAIAAFKEETGNEEVGGNDGYVCLTDATVKSTISNYSFQVPVIDVFYDQIIGITVGDIK